MRFDRMLMCAAVVAAMSLLVAPVNAGLRQPVMQVKPGQVSGIVADYQQKPVAACRVKLISGEKPLAETMTDADGKFTLEMKVGEYELAVGASSPMKIIVTPEAQLSEMKIVLPKPAEYSAGAISQTQWIWVGVGVTGVAVGTTAAVGAGGGGGGGGGSVSD